DGQSSAQRNDRILHRKMRETEFGLLATASKRNRRRPGKSRPPPVFWWMCLTHKSQLATHKEAPNHEDQIPNKLQRDAQNSKQAIWNFPPWNLFVVWFLVLGASL